MITQLKLFIQLKAKEQFQKYFFLKVLTQSDDISWDLSQILQSHGLWNCGKFLMQVIIIEIGTDLFIFDC